MKQVFLRKTGSERLLLVFAGWGMDENLIELPSTMKTDVMLCHDYRSLDFDASMLACYKGIRLLAWSMGVWVAGHVLGKMSLPWEGKVAFNGTPFPIDNERGIPVSVFEGTLNNFSETVLSRFHRRMCGDGDALRLFMRHLSQRNVEDLREELQALYNAVLHSDEAPSMQWDRAVIGLRDRIFPAENQQNAWKDRAEMVMVDAAHYDADVMQQLIDAE